MIRDEKTLAPLLLAHFRETYDLGVDTVVPKQTFLRWMVYWLSEPDDGGNPVSIWGFMTQDELVHYGWESDDGEDDNLIDELYRLVLHSR